MSKEVSLPSGAVLKLQAAPFADSKALYQALLEEGLKVELDPEQEIDANFYKNLFCVGFSSKKIELCIWKCMERALINDLRITQETFEPEELRGDYMTVLFEITKENIRPFTKSLYAQFKLLIETIQGAQA